MCHGQLLSDAIVKARKPRLCSWCRNEILPGDLYRRTSYVVDGDFDYSSCCRSCAIKLELIGEDLNGDEACQVDLDEDWRVVLKNRPTAALRLRWQELKVKFMRRKTAAGWLQA